MPRLSNAQKENIKKNTRQKLLDAATTEFANKGFSGANINHISIAAGYATGTVYNYFPSKRALMLALIDEIGAHHTAFIVDQVVLESQPTDRVKAFFDAGFRYVEAFPQQAQVAISAVYGFDPEFKERIYQAYQALFNLIIDDIVALGVRQGNFKPENGDTVAAMLMSIYLGGSSLYTPDGGVWFDAEKVTAFVMDGLRMQNGGTESEM
jgi:AcrR family transcriptional regulator